MFGMKQRDYKEIVLRGVFVLILLSLILGISMNKILVAFKLKDGESLVSLSIDDKLPFPVWPSFICGIDLNLTRMAAQSLRRDGSGLKTLSDDYIALTTTESMVTGDWTNGLVYPCFVFDPKGELFFKIGDIDQIILLAFSNQENPNNTQNGLLFGIFNEERNLSSVVPFVSPTPSINTYTFTRYQEVNIENETKDYFYVNNQNTITTTFGAPNLVARFIYSPDTYMVVRYIEKRKYTPYDLISAVGGLITYAFAAWVIMFGRGKYRSWGLVQRYLLRNSPNARKNDDSHEKQSDIESQINTNTLVGSPVTLGSDDKSRPSSTYYFSDSGTPTRTNFTSSLPPNNVLASPSNSLQSKDLIKGIVTYVNQKLWFIEQTLSRHYLVGFKIRKYDIDLNKLGPDGTDEALTPPIAHHNWNKIDSDVRAPYQDSQTSPLSYYGSQHFKENSSSRSSLNSLNPEEQRPQHPNVSISQVPFEKKHRGSGNHQHLSTSGKNTASSGITASKYDGNYFSPIIPIRTSSSSLQISASSNSQKIRSSQ